MKHLDRRGVIFFLIIDAALVAAAVSVLFFRNQGKLAVGGMRVTSPVFAEGGMIPAEYTCDGADEPPPLAFDRVPRGTKSLALVVEDTDAAFGVWTHWLAWNFPASTALLPPGESGALPPGTMQGVTSAGGPGWRGPCPPFGTHRYVFRLHALDALLPADYTLDAAALGRAMQGHVLETAKLTGRYSRKP